MAPETQTQPPPLGLEKETSCVANLSVAALCSLVIHLFNHLFNKNPSCIKFPLF